LLTEIVAFDDQHCIVKATVLNADGNPIANGIAHETRTSSAVNKTSMLENGETSAWGRALGNLGIGIDTSIATAEEVGQAIKRQESPESNAGKGIDKQVRKQITSASASEEQKNLIAKLLASNKFNAHRGKIVNALVTGKRTAKQTIDYLQENI